MTTARLAESIPTPTSATPPITFVACIEAGILEQEVVLMVRSLRRFGGVVANAPLIAVRPRFGPSLSHATRSALDELGVQLVETRIPNPYPWNGFMNKPLAVQIADPLIKTPWAAFLDGDMLIVKSLDDLLAHPDVDFLACVEEMGPVSTGAGNRFEPFWCAMAGSLGIAPQDIPFVKLPFSEGKIRIYFNSGVFRYRPNTIFAPAYLKGFQTTLQARLVPSHDPSIFLHEQITVSLVVAQQHLKFLEAPSEYNFHTETNYDKLYPADQYGNARIFHYHRALRGKQTAIMLSRIDAARPDVSEFLKEHWHGWAKLSLPKRVLTKLLYMHRRRRERLFTATCKPV